MGVAIMQPTKLMQALAIALGPVFALSPTAHAGDLYRNVDHSNDMGIDTGDSRVEGLNAGQLRENYRGTVEMRAPNLQTAQTPPSYAPH
jgi:hypothetical protein